MSLEAVITHDNADFDAVAAVLAAYRLNPNAVPVLPDRLNQNVSRFMLLYQNGLPFVPQRDFRAAAVSRLIVVDTQRPLRLRGQPPDVPMTIMDHHPLARPLEPQHTFISEAVGAVTTLLVEQIRQRGIPLTPLEATLLALGIYEDTGSLAYSATTPRDLHAAAWLLENGAVLDTVRRFLSPPLGDEQQALYDRLMAAAESRRIEGCTIILCAASVEQYITEISSVAHRLRDTLDPDALFIVVQMPESIQMVGRATVDALDVGEIARLFGGGGHNRAAAAAVRDRTLAELVSALWQAVTERIRPMTRVADLMSHGVHTIAADQPVGQLIRQLRRIGHEGYPVVEHGRVIGLLTRRDADRAIEHGLRDLPARAVMAGGTVTVRPDDSVLTLEQRMVESGWGQIPVVDSDGALIGIVTRTDLIKHWARIHPTATPTRHLVSIHQMENILGRPVTTLIQAVVAHAQEAGVTLYLVGGIVRDLLLYRRNLDIDFVAESDGIALAEGLQKRYGGRVSSFKPFGTAKWKLDDGVAAALGISGALLPDHLDFATSRNEFYEHPTALPTVYQGSIKLDLQRRDFTINALAIQLSPAVAAGQVLDNFGGLGDLQAGLIRVLHSLSFVDDPTRILRAVRFEQRLGFTIESRTAELIAGALPMLERITGERLRNELTLLLREAEPERGLLNLQARGALTAIQPGFVLPEGIAADFQAARALTQLPFAVADFDAARLGWHLIAARLGAERLPPVSARLMFGRHMADSLAQAAALAQEAEDLVLLPPSAIVERLTGISDIALLTAWLRASKQAAERIQRFVLHWRQVHPLTDGHALRQMGIKPGPCYAIVLKRLRAAWLDGEIRDAEAEARLLESLLHQESACRS